ncbi:hypothetical protein FOQG_19024 [Fusarium oxysporum f. sp. raphani 54005]|uniref:Uncharacterized protein n=1 Tax=Fusarium oxysporum f. sp. raphani 54005 TaxID=1089458 RepID=X0BBN6_FUSOX|nr:hypothetical protein FOQG_19024 [Fusarium oxysporum f. sp. raphani 54005]
MVRQGYCCQQKERESQIAFWVPERCNCHGRISRGTGFHRRPSSCKEAAEQTHADKSTVDTLSKRLSTSSSRILGCS